MSVNIKKDGELIKIANNISIVQADWNDRENTNKNTSIKNQPETIKTMADLIACEDENALAGAVAVKDTINDMASSMSNIVSANDLSNTPFKTDLLDVDLLNPNADKNRVHRIAAEDASILINSPITTDKFYAKWECIYYNNNGVNTRLMVKITEFYPVQGRIWVNHYNYNKWVGWSNDNSLVNGNLTNVSFKNDLLDVDLQNPNAEKNKIHKFSTYASNLVNSPITTAGTTFRGKWECIFHNYNPDLNNSTVMVKITELYPVPGRVWVNHHNYNDGWSGWKDRFEEFIPKNDIVNNLTSTSTTAPLAAAQGKNIKSLIDSNIAADVYSNRFLQMIANGEKLYVVSNNINDTVYSGGRGFKRNSNEKIIIGRMGATHWGYYMMGATQESLAYINATEHGEMHSASSFTTPLGNTVYIAVMSSPWETPSASNYVIATINGVKHIIKERTFTSSASLTTDIAKWILGIADVELFNDSTLQPLDSNYTISDKFFNNLTNVETKTNLLLVDLTSPNADVNKVHKIFTTNTSTLTNSPINNEKGFVGKWEYIYFENNRGMVQITELYPIPGRVWSNYYNASTAWGGWKSEDTLINGIIIETDLKTDLLDVDLTDPKAAKNRKHRFNSADASTLTNSPITTGQFIGDWECTFHTLSSSNARVMVKITEYYPVPGRTWYNHYNWTAWTGWKNDATHSMIDNGSSIKANTTSGKVAGALGVKELYNELKAQFIPSDMKIEAGTVTTTGTTRTITLQGNYTKMLYFNIGNNANPSFPVFLPVGVAFTAPNKVTFNLKVYGNSGVDNSTTGYATGYIFIGQ